MKSSLAAKALVDWTVADPAAQNHTEDHLKDHNDCNYKCSNANQINPV